MKKVSCHDDKMEAYCNAERALEDKFYGIELNHVPRRYNEEADELAKISSGRITIPPNVFARDVAKPSVDLDLTPSSQEEPSGKHLVAKNRIQLDTSTSTIIYEQDHHQDPTLILLLAPGTPTWSSLQGSHVG
jgi:hypothetical protein